MIEFEVTDSTGTYLGQPFPNSCRVELVWNGVSTAELVFDDDADVWDLLPDDARVRVHRDGELLMTGRFAGKDAAGPVGAGSITFEDDFTTLQALGWQVPDAGIAGQGAAEYKRYSGPVETVVKAACTDLSARLGFGWSIPATTGLGSTVRAEFRMHQVTDKLLDLVKADQLRWSLLDGVLDVTEGALFPSVLTLDSGLIDQYRWSYKAPTATRVVVGGGGEGTARVFEQFIDTAREEQWGRIVEVFKDSRMADGEPLTPDGAEVLAANGPVASVSVDLVENAWFKYGEYHLGDRIPLQLGSLETTDVISRIVFTDDPDDGELVAPHIGTLETTTEGQLMTAIGRLARGLRDAGRR